MRRLGPYIGIYGCDFRTEIAQWSFDPRTGLGDRRRRLLQILEATVFIKDIPARQHAAKQPLVIFIFIKGLIIVLVKYVYSKQRIVESRAIALSKLSYLLK